jgi:hypothetical protein
MPVAISGVKIPDSTLAREAEELVRSYENEMLFNHSVRVFVFGAIKGHRQNRIASSRMLLDNFSPMIGSAPSNWFGGVYGEKDQHGRAAGGGVGGNGSLPVGRTGGERAHPRCAVRDDGLASQACGARASAERNGWTGEDGGARRAQA